MRTWINGLIGRWEQASRRRELARQLDRLVELAELTGEVRLAELVALVWLEWREGQTDDALAALRERRLSREEDLVRRRLGA